MPTNTNTTGTDTSTGTAAEGRASLNAEAAKISWQELQRFYAAGMVVIVDSKLDLIDVAWQMAQDNAPQFKQWLADGKVATASDAQALAWFEADAILWAVTVKPWVLVQEPTTTS